MDNNKLEKEMQRLVSTTHLQQYTIKLELEAFECNGWPQVEIILNREVVFDGEVKNKDTKEFTVQAEGKILDIRLVMKGKTNRNVDFKNNTILKNQYCVINDLKINDISIKHEHQIFWEESVFEKDNKEILKKVDGLYWNGTWRVELQEPVFPILNKLFQSKGGNKFSPHMIKKQNLDELLDFINTI